MHPEDVKAIDAYTEIVRREAAKDATIAHLQEQVETLQYKAEKYDAVVKALSVCDGGRYRNDTIESCILALKVREAAEAERDRLREALRETDCPRPCNGRPDDFSAGDCFDAGECGCGVRVALQKEPQP